MCIRDRDKEVCSKHNKTLEEVGSWKRTEMQLRDDKAHAFATVSYTHLTRLGDVPRPASPFWKPLFSV